MQELYYYGIPGQKWGVRRFQNPDGTLTEKGKKRYEELNKRINKNNSSKKYEKLMGNAESMYSNFKGSQLENNLAKSLYNNKWMESNAALVESMYDKYRPSREEPDAYIKFSSDIVKRYGMTKIASANMEDASYMINSWLNQIAVEDGKKTASLGMSMGTNPFMF